MKKYLLIISILVFAINSNLYAFSNKYFTVDDNGWKLDKQSEESMAFFLENFEPEEGDNTTYNPRVAIKVEKNDAYVIAKYDQNELDTFKSAVSSKAYQQYFNEVKSTIDNILKEKSPNYTQKQRTEIINNLLAKSGMKSTSYSNLGSSKAHVIEFLIGNTWFKRFIVVKLNYTFIVEFSYGQTTDIDSIKQYKDFINSFNAKDKNPTYMNYLIFGRLGKILLQGIILLAIGGFAAFIKKARS